MLSRGQNKRPYFLSHGALHMKLLINLVPLIITNSFSFNTRQLSENSVSSSDPEATSKEKRARDTFKLQAEDKGMEDRRRSPRMDVVLKVRFQSKEDFQEALIHNISEVGVYLATETPFEVGYQFLIEIELPDEKGMIKGECGVIWVNEIEVKDYPKGMGVQFINLGQKDQKLLEGYLDELGNK